MRCCGAAVARVQPGGQSGFIDPSKASKAGCSGRAIAVRYPGLKVTDRLIASVSPAPCSRVLKETESHQKAERDGSGRAFLPHFLIYLPGEHLERCLLKLGLVHVL